MDKFLVGCKRLSTDDSEASTGRGLQQSRQEPQNKKQRKYDPTYLAYGFSSIIVDKVEKPQCLICNKILAADSMKPSKLKRHLDSTHSEYVSKPIDYFQRILDQQNKQKHNLKQILSVPSKALLASYKVAHIIAKCKKAHTIAETLILPAAIEMVDIMLGESYATQLKQIPLADNTIGRRITDMAEDICEQLITVLKVSNFALQVDEATDVSKNAQLIAYVRYIEETDIKEELLFCKTIQGKATSKEIFDIINTFFCEHGINWQNCIGLCTDGAPSMSGSKTGLQALVKEKASNVIYTHCMLHRQALVSKHMSEELNAVFQVVTQVINYIRSSSLKGRLFSKLCKDMEARYTSVLYYCEVHWLSRAKSLQRVFDLKDEIAAFLYQNHKDEAKFFKEVNFITKLAYMVDIFDKLSILNKSMQGPQMNCLVQKDKISAFMMKLELWIENLRSNNNDMFSNLSNLCEKTAIEKNKNLFVNHMTSLRKQFSSYFNDLDTAKFEWVRNPFITANKNNIFELNLPEQEQLIELSCDNSLKLTFESEKIIKFWLQLGKGNEYCSLANKAVQVLLPFSTSYLCEAGFSAVACLMTKYRTRLSLEKELRASISLIAPRFEKLVAGKQAHTSH